MAESALARPLPSGASAPLLAVRGLEAWYGESHVLHGIDFDVAPGEVVTLLGRNGAGKTTTLKSIIGIIGKRTGSITFEGVQTIGPESFVGGEPFMCARQRAGVEAAQMGPAAHLAPDHPSLLQHLDVLRGGGERDREGLGELAHRALARAQLAQHPAAGGIAQGVKDGVEVGCM